MSSDSRSDAGIKQFYSRAQQTKVACGGVKQGHTQCYSDRNVVAFEQDTPDHTDVSIYTYIGTSQGSEPKESMMRRLQEQKMMKDKS